MAGQGHLISAEIRTDQWPSFISSTPDYRFARRPFSSQCAVPKSEGSKFCEETKISSGNNISEVFELCHFRQTMILATSKTNFESCPLLSGHSSSLLEANSHTIICRNVVGG